MSTAITLSIIIPVYNEASGITQFHDALTHVVKPLAGDRKYELIYCNDGSSDSTADLLLAIAQKDSHCRVISLSKNFGKEAAIVAGLSAATGNAAVLIDGDGQHPVKAIPKFYAEWQSGAQVVIGRRSESDTENFGKKIVSKLFYALYNFITGNNLDARATDYRLLDREVIDAYCRLHETNRLNRLLIDWLGFRRVYIPIDREQRIAGTSKLTIRSLTQMALDALISSSTRPLYILLSIGFIIIISSLILGLTVGVEQLLLGDPLAWKFTGTALLSIMILFLVGLLLVSQGIISLYIAASYQQAKQRPLYIIDKRSSYNIEDLDSR